MSATVRPADPAGEFDVPPLGGGRNLRQRVADVLRAAVIADRMRPGHVYSAPALAQRFGVSATPVREALLDLCNEGLVEPVRNKGFRVVEPSGKQLDDLTRLRTLIEVPTVAGLAADARDATRDAVNGLRPVARDLVRAARDRDLVAFRDLDRAFHLSLLALAGNPALVEIAGNLRARSRRAGLDHDGLIASAQEHEAVLDHVLREDQAAVAELMTRHISRLRDVRAGGSGHS
ncbi:GntR family transcriptional regulator [Streptantibioticus silvisoli]|uniref:GntR family transcriptional regulator n=1 Tax=Streptantibioticus silvisoli TaxID=2705255 RepID=A0ABT6W9V5_9ACTN|nr:GntR family transcriptional regulator [Streptantibioticus silvisoli]MDI5966453.1 GntR family transcriptional regulator [Streptantibioticus silvisoli]